MKTLVFYAPWILYFSVIFFLCLLINAFYIIHLPIYIYLLIFSLVLICSLLRVRHVIHNKFLMLYIYVNYDWRDCCYCCLVTKSCPTLYDAIDCSLPGFNIHGIFQARLLECGAISCSGGSSQPKDEARISCFGRHSLPLHQLSRSP